MTPDTYPKTVNAIAIVASAAFAGGGLLILVSYGIRWLDMNLLVWRAGFWAEFMNFALTIIPVSGITLVGLVASSRLDLQDRALRKLWMPAIWLSVANTMFTRGYFIPQNIRLIWDRYIAAEAANIRATRLGLNVLRVAIALAVPVFALLAVFKRLGRTQT